MSKSVPLLCAFLLFFSGKNWAEDDRTSSHTRYFLGADVGYQWAKDDSYQHSEPTSPIVSLYGGLTLSSEWSWDIGYQYHDSLETANGSITLNTWLLESAFQYDWSVTDELDLYARAGIAYWLMDKEVAPSGALSKRGISPLFGLGIVQKLETNLYLRGGYQLITGIGSSKTGEYDSHAVIVGLQYKF